MKTTQRSSLAKRKVSEKKLASLRMHAADVIHQLVGPKLEHEITGRVIQNARLVGLGRELQKQVLIVLADYHDHAWANKAMASETFRFNLMERILSPTFGTSKQRKVL